MSFRLIGESISDAIDWTQDTLGTTRPLAEQVLFALLLEKKVLETARGYMADDDDKDSASKIHSRIRQRSQRPRFRFHETRNPSHPLHAKTRKSKIGWTDQAQHIPNDDNNDDSSDGIDHAVL